MGESVREYAKKMAEMSTGVAKRAYEYILRNGEHFEGASQPSEVPLTAIVVFLRTRGKRSWCWFNAQMLSLSPLGFDYYEGVADNGVFTGAHAWNVYKGRVVDVTWEDLPTEFKELLDIRPLQRFQYLGVKIPRDFVRKHNPIRAMTVQPLLFRYLEEERRDLTHWYMIMK